MPVFRNVKTRRSARNHPVEYDDQGWQKYSPDLLDSPPATRGRSESRSPSPDIYTPSPSPSPPPAPKPKPKGRGRRAANGEHIPRPRNAFIIFRSAFYALHKGTHDQNWISVHAGITWKSMSDDEKAPYQEEAEQEKAEHKVMYPEYVYAPGSKVGAAKRRSMLRKKAKAKKLATPAASSTESSPVDIKAEPRSPSPLPSFAYPSRSPSPIEEDTPELTDSPSSRMSSEEVSTPVDEFVDTADIPELLLPPLLDEKKADMIILKPDQLDTQLLPPNYHNLGDAFVPAPGAILQAYDSLGCFIYPPEESFGIAVGQASDLNDNFENALKHLPEAARDGRYNHSDVLVIAHLDGLKNHDPHEELISQLEDNPSYSSDSITDQFMDDFMNFEP